MITIIISMRKLFNYIIIFSSFSYLTTLDVKVTAEQWNEGQERKAGKKSKKREQNWLLSQRTENRKPSERWSYEIVSGRES